MSGSGNRDSNILVLNLLGTFIINKLFYLDRACIWILSASTRSSLSICKGKLGAYPGFWNRGAGAVLRSCSILERLWLQLENLFSAPDPGRKIIWAPTAPARQHWFSFWFDYQRFSFMFFVWIWQLLKYLVPVTFISNFLNLLLPIFNPNFCLGKNFLLDRRMYSKYRRLFERPAM